MGAEERRSQEELELYSYRQNKVGPEPVKLFFWRAETELLILLLIFMKKDACNLSAHL